ncbi:hypothetical protein [Phaffia rhodozyma]|uniref:Uncharacterized protein n=1 Tax=Phaffia rhodozyma TaxID=264483 RepID=A0A0F7SKZ6_PHARH|nr:hypothetical protein [Phaffia rhodozyma]
MVSHQCQVAQWKRAGLITRRSPDRDGPWQHCLFARFPSVFSLAPVRPSVLEACKPAAWCHRLYGQPAGRSTYPLGTEPPGKRPISSGAVSTWLDRGGHAHTGQTGRTDSDPHNGR